MSLSVANSNINSARPQSQEFDPKLAKQTDDLADVDLGSSDSRKLGEELAIHQTKELSEIESLPKEEKAIEVLNSVANIGRKIGSKALNLVGIMGATLTGLTYMFSFKILSLFIAIPTAGTLYLANHLKNAAKKNESDLGILTDPLKIIKKAKSDSLFLEESFNKVLASMVKIGEFKNNEPRRKEALKDLSAIAKKIRAKITELNLTDKTSHELLNLNKFLDIYEGINPSQAKSASGTEAS